MQPDYEIWVDLNISPAIAKWITEELNIPAKSNYQLGLTSVDDHHMFREAKKSGNVIILSKDTDFPALVTKFGSPPKVIYLSIGNKSNTHLWNIIKKPIRDAYQSLTSASIDIVEIR